MAFTFAELMLLVAVGVILYLALGPVQRMLEKSLVRWIRAVKGTPRGKPVIDITDYNRPKK